MRIAGKTFRRGKKWIKVEWVHGNTVSYNSSGAVQWAGGRCTCSRSKFTKMIERAGFTDEKRGGR